MEKQLIPAPIDNKNVMEDWIEDVFDTCGCVTDGKTAVGFIDHSPCIAAWSYNSIVWYFPLLNKIEDTPQLKELQNRLKQYEDKNSELVIKNTLTCNILYQQFYWNKEEN